MRNDEVVDFTEIQILAIANLLERYCSAPMETRPKEIKDNWNDMGWINDCYLQSQD